MHLTKNHNVIDAGLVAIISSTNYGTVYNWLVEVHATLKGTGGTSELSSARWQWNR